jgi:hypothetical protein
MIGRLGPRVVSVSAASRPSVDRFATDLRGVNCPIAGMLASRRC